MGSLGSTERSTAWSYVERGNSEAVVNCSICRCWVSHTHKYMHADMYIHIYAHINTHIIHTCKQTQIHTQLYILIHSHKDTHIQRSNHTYSYTHTQKYIHTGTYAHIDTCVHIFTKDSTHTFTIHTCICTYIHRL